MGRSSVFLILPFLVALTYAASLFSTNVGDEAIVANEDHIRCGLLVCPQETTGCTIEKKNNPNNRTIVDITRRCINRKGSTIAESTDQFEAQNGEYYDSYVNIGFGGNNRIVVVNNDGSNIEVDQKVQKLTSQINRQVHETVGQAMRDLEQNLQGLDDIFRKPFW